MERAHPFRLYRRTVGKSQKWYVVYDADPAHPRSTGVDASRRNSYDLAVSVAYSKVDGAGATASLRELTRDMFLETCRYRRRTEAKRSGRPYSSTYWSLHRGRLENYLWPRWGSMQPRDITASMLDDWLLDLTNTKGKPVSPGLGNKIIQTLRIVFGELHYRDVIRENTAEKVTWFDESARRDPFTLEEAARLFPEDIDGLTRIWLSLEWASFFYMMLVTGLRPGEAAAFRLADWVKGRGAVIERAIDPETREVKGLKTDNKGASAKPVIFNDRLEGYLTMLSYSGHDPEQLLFTVDGRPLIPDVSNKHFRGAAKRAGVELRGRTQYSLRHTYVTELLKHADEKTVAQLVGHTKLRREYDHRQAADFLRDNPALRDVLRMF